MKLIVGLGNPDRIYEKTYHNVGFMVLDKLKEKLKEDFTKSGYDAKYFKTIIGGDTVFVAKPQTYMNLSGQSVLKFCKQFKIEPKDVIVVCDDIDLPLGETRFRLNGSGGTHNGLRNIVDCLKSTDFKRVKVGIGRNPNMDLKDFVLIQSHILGKSTLTGVKNFAGDVNYDGKIILADFVLVQSHILKKQSL